MTRPDPPPRAQGRPLVLGHRGASADAPENTLRAFRLAMEQGADGIELDVWRCRSGEVVVFHDRDTSRITGAKLRISEARWSELVLLDAGGQWRAFQGERIPLLSEVLDAFPYAVVNVEMKSAGIGDVRLAAGVARVISDLGARERVVVSSFDYGLLAAFRVAAPRVPTGLLFDGDQAWRMRSALGAALLRPAALHPERTLVTPERASAWTASGYALNVWTVDGEEDASRLAALGAAAIITNVPGRIREAVRRATGR